MSLQNRVKWGPGRAEITSQFKVPREINSQAGCGYDLWMRHKIKRRNFLKTCKIRAKRASMVAWDRWDLGLAKNGSTCHSNGWVGILLHEYQALSLAWVRNLFYERASLPPWHIAAVSLIQISPMQWPWRSSMALQVLPLIRRRLFEQSRTMN